MKSQSIKRHGVPWLLQAMVAIAMMGALALAACQGAGDARSSAASGTGGTMALDGAGMLRLRLVDAPATVEGIQALNLTVSSVKVRKEATPESPTEGWSEVLNTGGRSDPLTVNVLSLVNGLDFLLAESTVEPGLYTQLRIVITDASMTVRDPDTGQETTSALRIPSGTRSGLKLVGDFQVNPNVITELTLDFDAAHSIGQTGFGRKGKGGHGKPAYFLKPVVRMVQTVLSGTVSGHVDPPGVGAVVTAYEAGTTNVATATIVDPVTGDFMLQALLAGTYDLEVTAPDYLAAREDGVVVTAGADSGGHDFTLEPAPVVPLTGSISGTVLPTGIDAAVTLFNAGTADVVASAPVDPDTGAYGFGDLDAGVYDLEVQATGYSPANLTGIEVVAGEDNGGNDVTLTELPPATASQDTTALPEPGPFATVLPLSFSSISAPQPIGFAFTFFGNTYTQFVVGSSGFIGFNDSYPADFSWVARELPLDDNWNNLIAGAWTALDPGRGGVISYETRGVAPNRKLVVDFDSVPCRIFISSLCSGPVSTQIVLNEGTNVIEVHTASLPAHDAAVTQGVENADGSIAAFLPGRVTSTVFTAIDDNVVFTTR